MFSFFFPGKSPLHPRLNERPISIRPDYEQRTGQFYISTTEPGNVQSYWIFRISPQTATCTGDACNTLVHVDRNLGSFAKLFTFFATEGINPEVCLVSGAFVV